MSNKKTYFISGGGTGGHIYPAFTIIEKLLTLDDTEKIYFIGNPENMEYDIAKHYPQVEFLPVKVKGMPRKLSIGLLKWGIELIFAVNKASYYLKKYSPDGIFTTGGYVSAPIVLASILNKHPYMIHDCDSIPGMVSKISAPKASIVSVAFENSKKILKSKNIIVNGNPVREAFYRVTKEEARNKLNINQDKKVIFITGGSQGAATINKTVVKLLEKLSADYYVILQTGKKNYDEIINETEKIYPDYKNNPNIIIKPYFDEMVYPLKSADIVISRAGSLSLSEIMASGAVSILIPYPFASQDHQRKNAHEMCEKGVSLYLEDSDCNETTLYNKIQELNLDKLESMRKKVSELALTNPTDKIVMQLKSTIK